MPTALATCSISKPAEAATGATKDIASPICSTDVFADEAVFARTSAARSASFAERPKPERTFEEMSAARARSNCPAAARSSVPPIAPRISSVLKPACARKAIPSAASFAEKTVVAPRAFASSVRSAIPVSVAASPRTALTRFIDPSKSAAVLNAAAPSPTIGAVTPAVRPFPADVIFWPVAFIRPERSCICVCARWIPAAKPDMSRRRFATRSPTLVAI